MVVYIRPSVKLSGKISESKSAYVGEQLAKMGHSAAPSSMSHHMPSCLFACCASCCVRDKPSLCA